MSYYSRAYYTYAGETQLNIPFPYIYREHVHLYVNNEERPFQWVDNTTIAFVSGQEPVNGDSVVIRRETPMDNALVDFQDGQSFFADDMDLITLHCLYVSQEIMDSYTENIRLDSTGTKFDAKNTRIVNCADPVNDQDVATKIWTHNRIRSDEQSIYNACIAEKDACFTFKTDCENAYDSMVTYGDGKEADLNNIVTTAQTDLTNAKDQAISDVQAASVTEQDTLNGIVTTAQADIDASVSAADQSEANAMTSELKAEDWANEAEDTEVEPGLYSAKHWAAKSEGSATESAAHAAMADAWANTPQDVEVETGKFSAKHWAEVAKDAANMEFPVSIALGGTGAESISQARANLGVAAADHNHDADYADKNHNHDLSYADINHDHNTTYAAIGHNHDSDYAAAGHNHDTRYELKDATILKEADLDSSANSGGYTNPITSRWAFVHETNAASTSAYGHVQEATLTEVKNGITSPHVISPYNLHMFNNGRPFGFYVILTKSSGTLKHSISGCSEHNGPIDTNGSLWIIPNAAVGEHATPLPTSDWFSYGCTIHEDGLTWLFDTPHIDKTNFIGNAVFSWTSVGAYIGNADYTAYAQINVYSGSVNGVWRHRLGLRLSYGNGSYLNPQNNVPDGFHLCVQVTGVAMTV